MSIAPRAIAAATIAALALAASSAPARPSTARACGTLSAAGGDVLRVYALHGVTCRKATAVARAFSSTPTAPKPWHCLTGTGQRYRGKAISFACGYGSRGPVMKRKHALVAVQAHTSG
jgi:hypothetical protein